VGSWNVSTISSTAVKLVMELMGDAGYNLVFQTRGDGVRVVTQPLQLSAPVEKGVRGTVNHRQEVRGRCLVRTGSTEF